MCKPGSASSGGGAASTGLGLAVVVLGAVALVSMAAAVISSIVTAVLVTLICVAAAGSILLVVQLYRTRGVTARPVSRPPAGRRSRPARGRIPPARPRPAVGAAARAAIPARQPLAIEAPAPVHARIGVPAGPGGLAMARLAERWPADTGARPVPDLLLPADTGGSVLPGLLLPAGRPQAPAAPVEDAVATR